VLDRACSSYRLYKSLFADARRSLELGDTAENIRYSIEIASQNCRQHTRLGSCLCSELRPD